MPPKRPNTQEYATTDRMARIGGWTDKLFANDDPVLQARGRGDLTVYRELLRDDQVATCYGQRVLAVQSSELQVIPASEGRADKRAAAWLEEQLDHLEWDDITGKVLYARHYGFSVAEMMWAVDGATVAIDTINVRDQNRFRFGTDGRLYLVDELDPQGLMMPERKFWTLRAGGENDDQVYGRGLAHQLYWPVFFKRGGIKAWMVFLERFAQPTPKATLPAGMIEDKRARQEALELLEAIQTDSGVLAPDTIPIELLEAARSGTADYDTLREGMDRAISKMILGQTMTTDQRGGQHKAEVAKDVRDELIKADADLISASFHQGPLAWAMEWNFPGARAPRLWRDTEPEEDLTERAERDTKIHGLGYEPTDDYIQDTYGEGWERRKEPEPAPGAAPGEPGEPGAEFTEAGESALHDADQQAIKHAALRLSGRYDEVIGERITQLLGYLEETGDYETFKAKLTDAVAAPPPPQAVDALHRSGLMARLMGSLRKQR